MQPGRRLWLQSLTAPSVTEQNWIKTNRKILPEVSVFCFPSKTNREKHSFKAEQQYSPKSSEFLIEDDERGGSKPPPKSFTFYMSKQKTTFLSVSLKKSFANFIPPLKKKVKSCNSNFILTTVKSKDRGLLTSPLHHLPSHEITLETRDLQTPSLSIPNCSSTLPRVFSCSAGRC